MSLDQFAEYLPETERFDLIFSNPPYFEDSLTAPDQRKSTARHTSDGLSYRDIFDFAVKRLSEKGRVAFVLPSDQEHQLCRYARMSGLHLFRMTKIRTVPRKAPSRMIAEFSRERHEVPEEELITIQDEGKYTSQYLSLVHDYYTFA
jgi:tRNA1Val (adenine37-N6)-methyltransferase